MTEKEVSIIERIYKSEYMDFNTIEECVDYPVWTFSVSGGVADNAVIGALSKKGYVRLSTYDKDETIALTQKGIEAYNLTKAL